MAKLGAAHETLSRTESRYTIPKLTYDISACLLHGIEVVVALYRVDKATIAELEDLLGQVCRLLGYEGKGQPAFATAAGDELQHVHRGCHLVARLATNECVCFFND